VIKFLEVEQLLVRHFLEGPNEELRYIDATSEELADALSIEPQRVREDLIETCGGPQRIANILNGDEQAPQNNSVPGFFTYLILACHVACSIKVDENSKNYRDNLNSVLNAGDVTLTLRGLPALWSRLKLWCDRRPGYKTIIIPEGIANHRIVGSTQAISFPMWRDVGPLQALLRRSQVSLENLDFVKIEKYLSGLSQELASDKFSDAFRSAWREYFELYKKSIPYRGEHRFWKMLELFSFVSSNNNPETIFIHLSFTYHQWTMKVRKGETSGDDEVIFDGECSDIIEELDNVKSKIIDSSSCLKLFRVERFMLFWEDGLGRYLADLPSDVITDGAILSKKNGHSLKSFLPKEPEYSLGEWRIDTFNKEYLSDIVEYLKESNSLYKNFIACRKIPPFIVSNGINKNNTYLSYFEFLPHVSFLKKGSLRLFQENGVCCATIGCLPGKRCPITSEQAQGQLTLVHTGSERPFRKKIKFIDHVSEHALLKEPDRGKWETIDEIQVNPLAQTCFCAPCLSFLQDNTPAQGYLHLLESIYFKGQNGLSDSELISMIQRVLPSAGWAWGVLRTLEETGWLRVRQSSRWGVRRWWLNSPHLRRIKDGVLLGGATPICVQERFEKTVRARGGVVERHSGVGSYSPQLLAAREVDGNALSQDLGWELSGMDTPCLDIAPVCWPIENLLLEYGDYTPSAYWCWEAKKFIPEMGEVDFGQIDEKLIMYRPERHNLRKLYAVSGPHQEKTWITSSRVAAIVEFHRVNKRPFFVAEDHRLIRTSNDGYLPLPIVRSLIHNTLCAPGITSAGNGLNGNYAYPGDSKFSYELKRLFGKDFVDDHSVYEGASSRSLSSNRLVRHRPSQRYIAL